MTWGPADKDGWQPSSLEFAFYHSLVDQDAKEVAPALEAYGRVAASWARMEHHIDALLIQINKPDHSESLFQKNHPASFSNKIELLKTWFNKYPPLAEYAEDVRALTSHLKTLSKDAQKRFISRNVLLHAIPASFDAAKGEITFHHMEFMSDGNIHSRHIRVTLDQMKAFADMVQLANKFLGHITQELFTPEGYEKLQKRE